MSASAIDDYDRHRYISSSSTIGIFSNGRFSRADDTAIFQTPEFVALHDESSFC